MPGPVVTFAELAMAACGHRADPLDHTRNSPPWEAVCGCAHVVLTPLLPGDRSALRLIAGSGGANPGVNAHVVLIGWSFRRGVRL